MPTPSSLWKLWPLMVCYLGVADNVFSAQTPPKVSVGAGGQSCGQWLSVQELGSTATTNDIVKEAMLVSWVQGFVVGAAQSFTIAESVSKVPELNKVPSLAASQARYGTVSGWVYDPPDSAATTHWITKYCKENPLEPISEAAMALVAELFARAK